MNVQLLVEQHLEFLRLKGDCAGSFESTLVKMQHCWKSHVTAHLSTSTVFVNWLRGNMILASVLSADSFQNLIQ